MWSLGLLLFPSNNLSSKDNLLDWKKDLAYVGFGIAF